VNNHRKDVIRGIQPRSIYQFAFLDYYEPIDWEVEENTNINVVEETEGNYL
jgi:hypothetical protein